MRRKLKYLQIVFKKNISRKQKTSRCTTVSLGNKSTQFQEAFGVLKT